MSHVKSQQRVAHIYNPENQTPQELIDNFVIRTKQFKKIFNSINTTSLNEPPQHFLIEGQRGTGKTSLMLRVRYELQGESGATHILPIQLPEEQYGIFDLCRLWENIADYLYDEPGFEDLIGKLETLADREDYPILCFTALNEFLISNQKRLVVFIDNFGDMLDRFTDIELKRLRDIFHTSKYIQLIAASAQTLEYTYKYEQPFFEFFKIIRLKNLDKHEAVSLLRQLAMRYGAEDKIDRISKEEPERIETIRLLTGGVPRTIVLLFEIFLDKSGNVFEDLEALLDRVTPLYKHRMDGLKPMQQAIIDVIALSWDGIGTAEIVKHLKGRRFDNKKVSAQLTALSKNELVSSRLVDKKNKIYFIRERFFNIWYLMRLGRRKNGDRVLWLVQFLKEWYAPEELISRTRQHIEYAQNGALNPKGAYLMCEAMAQIIPDMDLQDELVTETRNFLSDNDTHLAKILSTSDKGHFEKAEKAFEAQQYQVSINHLKEILLSSSNGWIEYNIALNFRALENYGEAIQFYNNAIDKGHTDAMFNLGNLYKTELKDMDKAIEYYQQAVDKGDTGAMLNLGNLYKTELKDMDKAIEYYQQAVDKGDTDAMCNLGNLYQTELKDMDKAIEYYQQAVDKGDTDAMVNLGNLYQTELKDMDKAIQYYQLAVDKGDTDAIFNLGYLYQTELKDMDKAIQYYQQAVDKGHTSAMFNLAILYKTDLKDMDKAIQYYQQAIDKDHTGAMNGLAWLYFKNNKTDQSNTAIQLIQKALSTEKDPSYIDTLANLLLWQNQFDASDSAVREIIEKHNYQDIIREITDYFIFLLAKKQLHAAHQLFIDFPRLQDEIKPVYYALMSLLKEEFPKEYLKMGEELETTVSEILKRVESVRVKYAA